MGDSQAHETGPSGARRPRRAGEPPNPAAAPQAGASEPQDGEAARTRREAVRTRQLARLGALFAGFAHEIKNPLSTIGLNLQLVKEDLGEPDSPRDQRIVRRLNVVESEVRRLQGILEQFLGYVRVPELRTRRMHLDSLLRELVEFVQPEMRERGVPVRFLGDGADREVELDADQFRAVIVNLLRNAMDACQDGGEVIVTTRTQGGVAGAHEAIVQVIDTGSGMTPDVREKAFTPYFSTKKQGTGLGLPTARRIVEQHGGSMQLDSEPGRGTAFTIRLPLAGASALPPREGASGEAADEENDG